MDGAGEGGDGKFNLAGGDRFGGVDGAGEGGDGKFNLAGGDRFGGVDGAREGVDGKSNMPGGVERGLGDCEFGGDEGLIELGRVGPTVMELVQIGVGFCNVDDMACVEVEGMLSGDRFSGIDVSGN